MQSQLPIRLPASHILVMAAKFIYQPGLGQGSEVVALHVQLPFLPNFIGFANAGVQRHSEVLFLTPQSCLPP